MGFIAWIIVGLIAGFLASQLMGKGGYGVVGDVIVGLIGAVIGGFLVRLFVPDFDFSTNNMGAFIASIVVAVIGAIVLIFLVRTLTKGRTSV
jgi:uncharacterized membrane protein YeaQ/YmgE (transglycosylase-associated protein family)